MLTLNRSLGRGGLVLVHPCRADGWWWLGGRWAWHDCERLFVERADDVVVVDLDGTVRVVPEPPGCLAWNDRAQVRVGTEVEVVPSRHVRIGELTARRAPAGRWQIDALELPLGALRARDLRPFPTGRGALWTSDGYLYRLGERVDAVSRSGRWVPGPHGAVLVGDEDVFSRGAAPGRAAVDLPCPLADPIRFSRDGLRVAGVGPDGEGVLVDLVAAEIVETRDAIPVGDGWLLPDGALEVDGQIARRGIREASWALRGDRLAGPGGRVWDLVRGAAIGEAEVQLGATVATSRGFSTVHWESGIGAHLDPDGRVVGGFRIPLEEDDVIVDGAADGAAALFGTAMGAGFRVDGATVAETPPPEVEHPDPPEGWELPVEGEVEVAGRRWAWSTEGLLLARE